MQYVPSGAPFAERGGRLRGVLDLLAGRYPPFVFGFGVGSLLPAFHFHDATPETLTPAFQYLAENGYRTVDCDEMAAVVSGRVAPRPRTVLLAFDDALASVWIVAAPLLRRFGFSAVTYAIPGRVEDAAEVRPTVDEGPVDAARIDHSDLPFATWPELRSLAGSGVVDVQSHTWSHSMMFCDPRAISVVAPGMSEYFLNRPRLNVDDPPSFLPMTRLGYPLFARRSRMSDARRFLPDEKDCVAVERFVTERGGAAFFEEQNWTATLRPRLAAVGGRWETESEQLAAIEHELTASRDVLEGRLGTRVRHLCLPWGVSGTLTRQAIGRLGFDTAIANQMAGIYAVRRGDDPFFLKRLPNRHIFALPGRGRRPFFTLR